MGNMKVGLPFYLTAAVLTKISQKCSLSSPLPNIWILSKPLNLIGRHGNRNAEFVEIKSKPISSETISGMKLELCRNVHNISLYKIMLLLLCLFALIAMATPLTYNGKNENETCHSLLSFSDILTKVLLNFYVSGVVLYLPYQFCPNW